MLEYGLSLRRDISAHIRLRRPELIVTLNHSDGWGPGTWNSPDHRNLGRAVLDAVGDAGNRWIFPDLLDEGLEPWDGVRWVAVAAAQESTHAVEVGSTLESAIASLVCHRAYIAALTDQPPETYARKLLSGYTESIGERFGGRPAVGFELFGFGEM